MELITKFIRVAEFAKRVGLHRERIYALIREGRLREGEDYKLIPNPQKILVVREDLDIKKV